MNPLLRSKLSGPSFSFVFVVASLFLWEFGLEKKERETYSIQLQSTSLFCKSLLS
uniref:Uncharacterized protein n=1 Tax=Utricularia reniformis TaxID=192314 RepID=A0A1Y0B2T5_9LAMI|nr:hypothetical protein AEK19_MT1514 [Utricularia reniformis]ART31704.1 hypothetical protein AEK19_MT1514 [Utricularia reniformis]